MKKYLSLIFVIIIAACSVILSSCGETPSAEQNSATTLSNDPVLTDPGDKTAADIDLSALLKKIIDDNGVKDAMDIPTESLEDLYGIMPEDVAESACATSLGGTFPDEIIMIKAANDDAMSRIEEMLSYRLDDVKVQSKSYDAENYKMAQECKIVKSGSYIALFLSAKHEAMENAFLGK